MKRTHFILPKIWMSSSLKTYNDSKTLFKIVGKFLWGCLMILVNLNKWNVSLIITQVTNSFWANRTAWCMVRLIIPSHIWASSRETNWSMTTIDIMHDSRRQLQMENQWKNKINSKKSWLTHSLLQLRLQETFFKLMTYLTSLVNQRTLTLVKQFKKMSNCKITGEF